MALANRQEEIREANGELLGLFYFDIAQGITTSAQETSEMMDEFGWRGGWTIEDNEDLDLLTSHGEGGGLASVFFRRFPIVYVIETATMRIVAGEKLDEYEPQEDGTQQELDVVAECQAIDEAS